MDAEGQAVTGRPDLLQNLVQVLGRIADDMQDRPEHLILEDRKIGNLKNMRGEIRPRAEVFGKLGLGDQFPLLDHPPGMGLELGFGGVVDHRADVGGKFGRVADLAFGESPFEHFDHLISDAVLEEQDAQRRTALPGAGKGRGHDVVGDLLRQR